MEEWKAVDILKVHYWATMDHQLTGQQPQRRGYLARDHTCNKRARYKVITLTRITGKKEKELAFGIWNESQVQHS